MDSQNNKESEWQGVSPHLSTSNLKGYFIIFFKNLIKKVQCTINKYKWIKVQCTININEVDCSYNHLLNLGGDFPTKYYKETKMNKSTMYYKHK